MVSQAPAQGRPLKIGRKIENARNCLIQRENWSKVYVRFFRPKHYKGWLTGKITNFYVVSPTLAINGLKMLYFDSWRSLGKFESHLKSFRQGGYFSTKIPTLKSPKVRTFGLVEKKFRFFKISR